MFYLHKHANSVKHYVYIAIMFVYQYIFLYNYM